MLELWKLKLVVMQLVSRCINTTPFPLSEIIASSHLLR